MSRDASDDDGYDHAPTRASDDEDEPRTMSDEDDEEEDARRMRNLNLDEAFEPVTSPVMRLKRAWVRERLAPEMMTREDALVEAVKTAVEAQERALTRRAETRAERGGGAEDASEKLMDNVMWVEVNRIKYLLREYARTRLRKIEAHAFYFILTEEGQERLTRAVERGGAKVRPRVRDRRVGTLRERFEGTTRTVSRRREGVRHGRGGGVGDDFQAEDGFVCVFSFSRRRREFRDGRRRRRQHRFRRLEARRDSFGQVLHVQRSPPHRSAQG